MSLSFKICLVGCSGVGKSSLTSQFVNHQFLPDHQVTSGSEGYFFNTKVGERSVLLEIEDTKGFDTTDEDTQLAASLVSDGAAEDGGGGGGGGGGGEPDEDDDADTPLAADEDAASDEDDEDEKDLERVHIERSELEMLGQEQARSGFLVVFDLTRRKTFQKARKMLDKIYARLGWDPAVPGAPLPILIVGNKSDAKKLRRVTVTEGEALARDFNQAFVETSAYLNENVEAVFQKLAGMIVEAHDERKVEGVAGYDPMKTAYRDIHRAEKRGYLVKRGHIVRSWKRRLFVLKKGLLWYFATPEDGNPRGVLEVDDCEVREAIPSDGMKHEHIMVLCGDRIPTFFIQAPDEKAMHDWIDAIQQSRKLGGTPAES